MKKIEQAIDSLRTNRNFYRSWDKSKRFGKFHWLAFMVYSIVPLWKLLCGQGDKYKEELKKNNCVLKLDAANIENKDVCFFLPNFEEDWIQKNILLTGRYYEQAELVNLKKNYVNNGSIGLDIGANIGNHTIYFMKECHASKVYSFEPVKATFRILQRNIELNGLDGQVEVFNCGISDRAKSASIIRFDEHNIGATQLSEDSDGDLKLIPLDALKFPNKIDWIKIDVEGMEYEVLLGGSRFFLENKPVVIIEIWEENLEKVDLFFQTHGYSMVEKLSVNIVAGRSIYNCIYRYNKSGAVG